MSIIRMHHGLHTSRTLGSLTLAQRRQGIGISLASSFLMVMGYTTIFSAAALHFTHDLAFTAAAVGLALALRSLMQQGLDIFGGFFAERTGYRFSITLGCLIRVGGFVGMGLARTMPQLLIVAFVIGFGGMFFDAASSGVVAALVSKEQRTRIFALQATINNTGGAIGPLLGLGIYMRYGFTPVAFLAAAIFLLIGVLTFCGLPEHIERRAGQMGTIDALTLRQTLHAIMAHRSYVRVILLLAGYWSIAIQTSLTVPLAANRVAGTHGVALILGLNAFLAIPLQYPLVRLASRFARPMQIIASSMVLTTVGLAILFLSPSFAGEVVGIIIATIGSLAISPTMASITAQVAPPRALAAFYGFSMLGLGFGGALGQYVGGRLFDLQDQLHLPWMMSAVIVMGGFVLAIALAHTPDPVANAATESITVTDEDIAAQSGIITIA